MLKLLVLNGGLEDLAAMPKTFLVQCYFRRHASCYFNRAIAAHATYLSAHNTPSHHVPPLGEEDHTVLYTMDENI